MMDPESQDKALGDLFSDFDERIESGGTRSETGRKPSKKPGRVYRSALDEQRTDRRSTAKATGKRASVAGHFIRRSFTYRPDQLEKIEKIAEQLGLSQNDLMRWFTDMGVEAVEGGERPPVAEVVRRKYEPGR